VFERNEYAGSLSKDEFKGLVVEITGLDTKDKVVQLVCLTFEALKSRADFEQKLEDQRGKRGDAGDQRGAEEHTGSGGEFDLRLNYTIQLVLPKTDDPAVFNAIFRALRDNLLRK
jgi:hypothetical protein